MPINSECLSKELLNKLILMYEEGRLYSAMQAMNMQEWGIFYFFYLFECIAFSSMSAQPV